MEEEQIEVFKSPNFSFLKLPVSCYFRGDWEFQVEKLMDTFHWLVIGEWKS